MFIPEKKDFLKELESLQNENTKAILVDLYDHLLGKKAVKNPSGAAKEALKELFPATSYSTDTLIPIKFLDSLIAKVLFSIMYGVEEKIYTVNDIMEMSINPDNPKGYSKQYLNHEIDLGRLKGIKKNNNWMFTESEVNRYMKMKGLLK